MALASTGRLVDYISRLDAAGRARRRKVKTEVKLYVNRFLNRMPERGRAWSGKGDQSTITSSGCGSPIALQQQFIEV
jgi:hypothetical protein